MSCGIYKITSPSGKIYIGRSVNIEKRFREYKNLASKCEGQTRLWRSFQKYGVELHLFEVLEVCLRKDLNYRERYWQEKLNVLSDNGLNCLLNSINNFDSGISEETRKRLSTATSGINNPMYGIKRSDEWKKQHSLRTIGRYSGSNNPMYGKVGGMRGKKHTEESLKKMRDFQNTNSHPNTKTVLDTQTGIFFRSIREAADAYGLSKVTLAHYLVGRIRNKTNLIIC